MTGTRIPILVVEDEPALLETLEAHLVEWEFQPRTARTGKEALESFRAGDIPVVLTDMRLPDMDGLDLVTQLRELAPHTQVVLMTGYYSVESAVSAIRRGAFDYLCKPFPLERLRETLAKLRHHLQWEAETELLADERIGKADFHGLIGSSPGMRQVCELIARIAPHFSSVLVAGETGTGKELVARALHALSPVAAKPLVICNCSALVPTLVESQLFGYVRGAFTGATESRAGLFEAADGGTIFLDEVGELTPSMQARLLRVLESGEVQRIGSTQTRQVNVRVIAATNRDLVAAARAGTFREDLLYRLNAMELHLPPLRECGEDVLLLARHFLRRFSAQFQKDVRTLSREAQAALLRYRWPGNVRELENAVERATMLCPATQLRLADLPEPVREGTALPLPEAGTLPLMSFEQAQRELLITALKHTRGNRSQAAVILGVSRPTLYRLLEKFGLGESKTNPTLLDRHAEEGHATRAWRVDDATRR